MKYYIAFACGALLGGALMVSPIVGLFLLSAIGGVAGGLFFYRRTNK